MTESVLERAVDVLWGVTAGWPAAVAVSPLNQWERISVVPAQQEPAEAEGVSAAEFSELPLLIAANERFIAAWNDRCRALTATDDTTPSSHVRRSAPPQDTSDV